MTEEIAREIDRIRSGPRAGFFTFLRHQRVLEYSGNVMERIEVIFREKLPEEHLVRLCNIYPVDDDLAYDYNVKCEALTGYYYLKRRVLADNYSVKWKALSDDYSVKRRALDDKITAIIPDCKWDGRTILHG